MELTLIWIIIVVITVVKFKCNNNWLLTAVLCGVNEMKA
jgi:hypothetical protein